MICGRTPTELLEEIQQFHGFVAPGVLIGAFMIDRVYEHLEKGIEADAIVETRHCLPDAIQILTPCTIGNGWLKIVDFDKFALTMYNRHDFKGYRVWMDLDKAKAHDNVYNWYMGLVSKKELPIEVLKDSIFAAGSTVFSVQAVKVSPEYGRREKKGEMAVCHQCNEAYSTWQGEVCMSCQGKGYYQSI